MISQKICPVILSGGAGTRLWPLSRVGRPKQMLRLIGEQSLIQQTVMRAPADERFDAPVIVAGTAHEALIDRQLAEIGVEPRMLIFEPAGRNTAPAIGLAAAALDPDDMMLVMPSDHVIKRCDSFLQAVLSAAPHAAEGWLTTFGIKPDRAETGYGYIEAGASLDDDGSIFKVARFVEKPDAATAEAYCASGRFYWNAGIFLMRAGSYLDALRAHAPEIAAASNLSFTQGVRSGRKCFPDRGAFLAAPSISIDYAVMEKSGRVAVVPVSMGWSDIGAFSELWKQLPHDADGNAVAGDSILHATRNTYVHSDGPLVAVIGLGDISVIAADDAVLVVSHDRAQDVKVVVDTLKAAGQDTLLTFGAEETRLGERRNLCDSLHVVADIVELQPNLRCVLSADHGGHAIVCEGEGMIGGKSAAPGIPVAFVAGDEAVEITGAKVLRLIVIVRKSGNHTG